MDGFLWVELIIMVFIIQGILIGAISGLIIGASMGALGGAIKGAAFNSVVSLVSPSDIAGSKGKIVVKTLKKGTVQGCIVGGFVGLTLGIIAAIRINI